LCRKFCKILQKIRQNFAKIVQNLRKNCGKIGEKSRKIARKKPKKSLHFVKMHPLFGRQKEGCLKEKLLPGPETLASQWSDNGPSQVSRRANVCRV